MFDSPDGESEKLLTELCARIERVCRYSPLNDDEVDEESMDDRQTVEDLYYTYKMGGYDQDIAARKARADTIRLIMNEIFQ